MIISLASVFDNAMELCSHCKDVTIEAFIEYGSDHVPFAYYSFDYHIPKLMSNDMYSRINNIKDFSLVNHKHYSVSEERLNALNGFIYHGIHKLLQQYSG